MGWDGMMQSFFLCALPPVILCRSNERVSDGWERGKRRGLSRLGGPLAVGTLLGLLQTAPFVMVMVLVSLLG